MDDIIILYAGQRMDVTFLFSPTDAGFHLADLLDLHAVEEIWRLRPAFLQFMQTFLSVRSIALYTAKGIACSIHLSCIVSKFSIRW